MKTELAQDKLVIKLDLLEELGAIKRELEIPISSIVDIKPFKEAGVKVKLRLGGTDLGKIKYGRYTTSKGWAFIATKDVGKATVLFFKNFDYDLAILDLDEKTVKELKDRI